MQRIPTDMRNFQILRNCSIHRNNRALEKPEALMLSVFKAFLKKQLHSETDSHNILT